MTTCTVFRTSPAKPERRCPHVTSIVRQSTCPSVSIERAFLYFLIPAATDAAMDTAYCDVSQRRSAASNGVKSCGSLESGSTRHRRSLPSIHRIIGTSAVPATNLRKKTPYVERSSLMLRSGLFSSRHTRTSRSTTARLVLPSANVPLASSHQHNSGCGTTSMGYRSKSMVLIIRRSYPGRGRTKKTSAGTMSSISVWSATPRTRTVGMLASPACA